MLLRVAVIAAVVLASLAGGAAALASYHDDARLSVGTVRLSVEPGHRGALDVYVPLVDWGARFEAIRFPARLRAEVRTVDRRTVGRVATGDRVDVEAVRSQARDAIAAYLRRLVVLVALGAAALGALVALAARGHGPRLRVTLGAAGATALVGSAALVATLPPRGEIDRPQYYAYGPDIPRALRAVEAATRSSRVLDQELDTQLVGLAQLVVAPGRRTAIGDSPRLTIASDLHNNVLAIPVLRRIARGGPVLFVGDATDRGTNLETGLVRQIVATGEPFVFVSGNHDSDILARRFARDGAIVLTQDGRLMPDGDLGPVVARVRGLRVAGYSDPFERSSADGFRDRYDDLPTEPQQTAFDAWLRRQVGKVDVVMVHEPRLIEPALERLRAAPPPDPIVFAVGHTHRAELERGPNFTVVNGGSIGSGGTGNLGEGTPLGLASLVYDDDGRFRPLAGDLVAIDPGTGSSTARRVRLDVPLR